MKGKQINYSNVNKGFRSIGFEWPLNKYQVLIFLDLVFSSVLCPCVTLANFEEVERFFLVSVFFCCLGGVAYYWIRTSIADPTDPIVKANRNAILNNTPFESSRYENMCTVCTTSVGYNSKHCGTCNRCVHNFDHHCIWLNNCIGYNNYHLFIKLIIVLFLYECTIVTICVKLLVNYNKGDLGNIEGLESIGVLIFLILQSAALIIFLLNLIILHAWLYKKGISTYEFIKSRREKKEKRGSSVVPDPGNTALE